MKDIVKFDRAELLALELVEVNAWWALASLPCEGRPNLERKSDDWRDMALRAVSHIPNVQQPTALAMLSGWSAKRLQTAAVRVYRGIFRRAEVAITGRMRIHAFGEGWKRMGHVDLDSFNNFPGPVEP